MVEIIEKSVCRGIAGRLRSTKGVMIHNTADNHSAKSHASRLAGYTNKQLENGYANYFIDKDTIYRTEDTYNATYHSANGEGNYNYISFEVVGDMKTSKADFLQAEQNTFYQAAIDLRYHKLPVNRSTVRLHCELDVGTYTECPKRSLYEHTGYNSNQRQPQNVINAMKDYFIKEIKKYYDNPKLKPNGGGTTVNKANKDHYGTGNYFVALQDLKTMNKEWTKQDHSWLFKKGSRFAVRNKIIGKNGNVHAQVAGLDNTYVTLAKTHVKPQ